MAFEIGESSSLYDHSAIEETVGTEPEETEGAEAESEINLQSYQLARDKTRREIRLPSRYATANIVEYALNSELNQFDDEPMTYKEAVNSSDRKKWKLAMEEEMDSLYKNHT